MEQGHSLETASLTVRERHRLQVMGDLEHHLVDSQEAGERLGLSTRQVRRLRTRFRDLGPEALAHGNRGRKPSNAVPDETRQLVVDLVRTRYRGVALGRLTERLREEHGLRISRPTVHRVLAAAGLLPRSRHPPQRSPEAAQE